MQLALRILLHAAVALLAPTSLAAEEKPAHVSAARWRIVNSEPVEVAWRIRTMQFFADDACTDPLEAVPNVTGEAFASEASDMTGAEHIFALRSPRGWESTEACEPGECFVGFAWGDDAGREVRCVLLQQGDEGFHAPGIKLQRASGDTWSDVVAWSPVEGGRAKLAAACPARPTVERAEVSPCSATDERTAECAVRCADGFGTVEPRQRCVHGAWYSPECLPVGSMIRVVAEAPELIKPYWVVLHAILYASEDCTDLIRMDGASFSSGEYVIKYASYHPHNVWDGDAATSWAAKEPCTPGSCYIGFRFREAPAKIGCVRIEHPDGRQYQATQVTVETLGASGWEPLDVRVELLPRQNEEL